MDDIQKTLFERDQSIPDLAEFPERVPLECKGSFKRCNALWSGLWQLIEYWHSLAEASPDDKAIGCGLLTLCHDIGTPKRQIDIHLFAPKNRNKFLQRLLALDFERPQTAEAFKAAFPSDSRFLGWP